ncbi:AraC-like DNA-binding protein [Streptomyces sp. TLI_171]|nr:AraC-like DNA-binding protein [Streptomyces sp. TLI_171]
MLVLRYDSAQLPRDERGDAFHAFMREACDPCRVVGMGTPSAMRVKTTFWQLGTGIVHSAASTGYVLTRTPRHLGAGAPEVLALGLQLRGTAQFEQHGRQIELAEGEMMINDLTAPYDYTVGAGSATHAFMLDLQTLGVSVDAVRLALPYALSTPVYPLVRSFLTQLYVHGDQLSLDPGRELIASAGADLVRAMLLSAIGAHPEKSDALRETLTTRILAYVRAAPMRPGLSAESIAAAHDVSVRTLYKELELAGTSLEGYIIEQRLEGAARELADPASTATVGAVARAWGFTSQAHFSRRFKNAHGTTPTEWRRSHAIGVAAHRSSPRASFSRRLTSPGPDQPTGDDVWT